MEREDLNMQLEIICGDLRALRLAVQTVEGSPDHGTEKEMLAVVRRVLEAVTEEMHKIIDGDF